jgi:putative ABC transport system permease protein
MNTFLQDLKYGIRILLKNPGFTLAAVLSLMLGIGLNAAIFSVANSLLFKPLPVSHPEQLVRIYSTTPDGLKATQFSFPNYADYRSQNQVFSGIVAINLAPITLATAATTQQILGEVVSGDYFSLLGVPTSPGRAFGTADETQSEKVVVISQGLWKRRFARDPAVIGKILNLNGEPYTILGVAGGSFSGTFVGAAIDVWVPIRQSGPWIGMDWNTNRTKPAVQMIARLKPGVSIQSAQAAMNTLARQLASAYPDPNRGKGIELAPATLLHGNFRKAATGFFAILMVLVALILLIACTNIANLLLSRAIGRRREISIRTALGASQFRLMRQLITESILLSLLGGIAAFFVCLWTMELLMKYNPVPFFQFQMNLSVDYRVVGFTLLTSLFAGLILGLIPAARSLRGDPFIFLKDRDASLGNPGRSRLRSLLVVSQVALSLLLLICASLFIRSLVEAQSMDPGFQIRNALIMDFEVAPRGYSEAQGRRFYTNLLERMRPLPGIVNATLTDLAPLDPATPRTDVVITGHEPPNGQAALRISSNVVGTDYMAALKIPMFSGRDFTEQDSQDAAKVTIINETMAERFWPGEDPIGKQFRYGEKKEPVQIIGIARNVKYRTLGEEPTPHMYLPFLQNYQQGMSLVVRTEGDPAAMTGTIRRELQVVDKDMQGFFTRTLEQHAGFTLLPARLAAILVGIFGLLALILSVIGIYGSVSYTVSQRTRELGVRIALGAVQRDVFRIVVGQGMKWALLGTVFGLLAAFAVTRFLVSLLYGISPTDPITFILIPLFLAIVALIACYIPARRASKVDPMIALRYE